MKTEYKPSINIVKSDSKIRATLIVNSFLSSRQTDETYQWIMDSGIRHGIEMSLMSNADFFVSLNEQEVYLADSARALTDHELGDFVIFWNKDICLARALEAKGYRLFNPANAIEWCDSKALTFEVISRRINMPSFSNVHSLEVYKESLRKIRMPKTFKIPMTFDGVGYTKFEFVDRMMDMLGCPMVIKECFGSYGGQVYLADSRDKAIEILGRLDGTQCIAQEYIRESVGRDLRVYVVGNRVVASMERRNPKDFRANIANGGSSLRYSITREQEEMAIAAARALNLDFAGVDLMFLDNEAPILCEVNSNAQFLGLYEATGINIPDEIFDSILSGNLMVDC